MQWGFHPNLLRLADTMASNVIVPLFEWDWSLPQTGAVPQLGGNLHEVVVGQVQGGQETQRAQLHRVDPRHLVVTEQDGLQGNHAVQDLREGLEPGRSRREPVTDLVWRKHSKPGEPG